MAWCVLSLAVCTHCTHNLSFVGRFAFAEANHVSGLKTEQIEAYITCNGSRLVGSDWEPWVEEKAAAKENDARASGLPLNSEGDRALLKLYAYMEGALSDNKRAFQLLNMSSEWLRIFLPHCLQKVSSLHIAHLNTVCTCAFAM